MPPVESYQRIDIQNTDDSSRQINKKSIVQTRSEARIENRSVRDTIEDSAVALSSIAAGDSNKEVNVALPVSDEAASSNSALDSDLAVSLTTTAGQSESLAASANRRNDNKEDLRHRTENSGNQFVAEKSNLFDVDNEGLGKNDPIERNQINAGVTASTSVTASSNASTTGISHGNNEISAEERIDFEDDASIELAENVTVEQAFHFLTEQTEDNYIQPATLTTQPTS